MNNDSLAVTWNIPDDQRALGMNYRVVGPAAVRAKAGDRLGSCQNVILALSFLEVSDIETGEVEEIDGHRNNLPLPSSRKRQFGGADQAFGWNSKFLMQLPDHIARQRALAVKNFVNTI